MRDLTIAVQYSPPSVSQPTDPSAELMRKEVLMLLRFAVHVQEVELRRTYPAAPDVINPAYNEDLRKRFLKNEIDEARFSVLLQSREKARRKRDAIHQILRTFVDVVADLLTAVIRSSREVVKRSKRQDAVVVACELAVTQAMDVADYANDALAAVAKRYSCMAPRVARTTGHHTGARWDLRV